MQNIKINLKTASNLGRLYYFHDPQIEKSILFLQNNMDKKINYSVNINHTMYITLNADHIITLVSAKSGVKNHRKECPVLQNLKK